MAILEAPSRVLVAIRFDIDAVAIGIRLVAAFATIEVADSGYVPVEADVIERTDPIPVIAFELSAPVHRSLSTTRLVARRSAGPPIESSIAFRPDDG